MYRDDLCEHTYASYGNSRTTICMPASMIGHRNKVYHYLMCGILKELVEGRLEWQLTGSGDELDKEREEAHQRVQSSVRKDKP